MDKFERSMDRKVTFIFALAVVWILFLIGAGTTVIWMVGKWLGFW